jgi:SWI/SNF-related matrix-associated actin-dependent regulator 1 of chromatin subfamily A
MGLGKTIQAIGVYNFMLAEAGRPLPMLVICPASLRLNWAREIQKWSVRQVKIGYVVSSHWPADCDVAVINYDVLERHRDRIDAVAWSLLVVDEAHYVKNPKALRTLAILGGREKLTPAKVKSGACQRAWKPIQAERKVFLTGTPIGNRPVELWSLAHALAPETFTSWKQYVYRYCAAKYNGYALDVSGASNLDELQQKLRSSIMVRRLKADVLTDLPPKRRQIIELPVGDARSAVRAEQAASDAIEERLSPLRVAVELAKASDSPHAYDDAVARLREASAIAFEELSKARVEVAMAKLPVVIEHLRENCDDKVIVFAHHKAVVKALMAELGDSAVCVTGDTPVLDRQAAVDAFQANAKIRVFVGTIMAAGVGLTLTASSHVVFAELDWVPGNLSQAEDRAHRIGQKNSVLVQHLVLDGSLDARMAKVLVEKQDVIGQALDAQVGAIKAPDAEAIPDAVGVPAREPAATVSVSRKQIEEESVRLTPDQIKATHQCLQILSSMDDDRALAKNNAGFGRFDTMIGNALAQKESLSPKQAALGLKIVRKYHRQLPADLLATAKG